MPLLLLRITQVSCWSAVVIHFWYCQASVNCLLSVGAGPFCEIVLPASRLHTVVFVCVYPFFLTHLIMHLIARHACTLQKKIAQTARVHSSFADFGCMHHVQKFNRAVRLPFGATNL